MLWYNGMSNNVHFAKFQELLEVMKDIERSGATRLEIASCFGHISMVELLLNIKATICGSIDSQLRPTMAQLSGKLLL